jgi:hypothetical protein
MACQIVISRKKRERLSTCFRPQATFVAKRLHDSVAASASNGHTVLAHVVVHDPVVQLRHVAPPFGVAAHGRQHNISIRNKRVVIQANKSFG